MWFLLNSKFIRVLACILAVLMLAGCSAASESVEAGIYGDVSSSSSSHSHKLAEVKLGSISRNVSGEGSVIYPDAERITCSGYEGTIVKAVYVKNGDMIEPGDVIAEFGKSYSKADLEGLYSNLSITEAQLEMQRTIFERAVDTAKSNLSAAKKAYAAGSGTKNNVTRAELRLELAEIDLDGFEKTAADTVASLQNAIDTFEADIADVKLISDRSGIITDVAYLVTGSVVSNNTEVCTIYSPDVFWLRTSTDMANTMRYNQAVEITVTKGAKTYSGRIVSSPNVSNNPMGQVIIAPNDIPAELASSFSDRMKRITILSKRIQLDNVIIIPTAAVENEDGDRYVYIYEDGIAKKRYVTVGVQDVSNIQIIDGLEVGQSVVVG